MLRVAYIICILCYSASVSGQSNSDYSVNETDSAIHITIGSTYDINIPYGPCYGPDTYHDIFFEEGEKYILIDIVDEMENHSGTVILDKTGSLIDYDLVQLERSKYYQYYKCCVFAQEIKGLIYFWDVIEPEENGKDYNCYYDSQTDASDHQIPRYYVFDPQKNSVRTVILKNKCLELIEDGKIVCH